MISYKNDVLKASMKKFVGATNMFGKSLYLRFYIIDYN